MEFVTWLLLVSWWKTVAGSYRYLYLENADICSKEKSDSKTLDIGAGSAIFALENASMYKTDKTRDKYKKCQILVKANEGYGLMAYVEQMHLRQDTRPSSASLPKCIDYIQFGRDDMIPFVTVYKSDKFCGERSGLKYDEPGGNLLVWLTLGPSRPSSYREALGVVKLSLIVTAYQKEGTKVELTSYRACNEGRRWIRKEYFCDGRTNCALDADPADESQLSCPSKTGKDLTTSGPSGGGEDIHPPLNLISITLVLVSCVVLLVLIAMLMLRVKRSRRCCWHRAGDNLCELPEHGPLSLHQLATHHNQAQDNLYGQDNNYLPLSHNVIVEAGSLGRGGVPGRGVTAESSLVNRTTPDQEPPPAYHDLFPADYVFEDKQNDVVDGQAKEESTTADATAKDDDNSNDDGEASESRQIVSEEVSSGNLNRISIVSDDPNTPRD